MKRKKVKKNSPVNEAGGIQPSYWAMKEGRGGEGKEGAGKKATSSFPNFLFRNFCTAI